MRIAIGVIVAIGVLIPALAAAQSPSLAQSMTHARSTWATAARVGSLFSAAFAPTDAAKRSQPAVRCGMTLIPADPKVDPSMRRAAPDVAGFPMRTVRPTICGDAPAR